MNYLIGLVLSLGLVMQAQALSLSGPATIVTMESPSMGSTMQGVANIRGWMLSHQDVDGVELFIDGEYAGNIPMGGLRQDVANAYPEYPDADLSGFSMAFYYGALDPYVSHTMTVAVFMGDWKIASDTVEFDVVAFELGNWQKTPITKYSSFAIDEDTNGFIMYDVFLNRNFYPEVKFEWSNESQGFVIVDIPFMEIDVACDEPAFSPTLLTGVCENPNPNVVILEED